MLFSKQDLKKLLIPLFFEQLLAVTIGMVDTVMVAGCGEAAVSGVSLVDSICVLLIGLFSSMAGGGAVIVGQYLGQQNKEACSVASRQLFYLLGIISGTLSLLCLCTRSRLLTLIFGTIEADVMSSANAYFLFILLSFVPLAIYNGYSALLRAQGDSASSFKASTFMNITNLIGNALLIYFMKMGAAGAGLSTLFSRIFGVVFMSRVLHRPSSTIRMLPLFPIIWDRSANRKIMSIGIPNGLENSLAQLGRVILLSIVSTFGTASIAANAVTGTLCNLECIPGAAVCLAVTTVVSRCIGAGRIDQARYYTRLLLKICWVTLGFTSITIIVGIRFFLMPFNLSQEAADLAAVCMTYHSVFAILIWPVACVTSNTLRAAGDVRYTMILAIIAMAMRIIASYLLAVSFGMGLPGIWLAAVVVDWGIRFVFFGRRYLSTRWETKSPLR